MNTAIDTPVLDLAPATEQEVRILVREGPSWLTLTVRVDFSERKGLKPMRFMEHGRQFVCDVWTRILNDRIDFYEDVCLEALNNGLNPHLKGLPSVMKLHLKNLDDSVDA